MRAYTMLTDLPAFGPLFVTFVLFGALSTIAEDGNERVTNGGGDNNNNNSNNDDDNYIITHYGKEYYTPVRSTEVQVREGGFFTAEVIPVDVNSGQELKSVKNIFVPMRTGYTIGSAPPASPKRVPFATAAASSITTSLSASPSSAANNKVDSQDVENKRKLPKKFKSEYATNSKKTNSPSPDTSNSGGDGGSQDEWRPESNRRVKKNPKRYASAPSPWFIGEVPIRNAAPDLNWNVRPRRHNFTPTRANRIMLNPAP